MRRGLSVILVALFAVQSMGAEQTSRYDVLLENQRARLAAAERNLPRYMTVGWFASAGFLLSLGALIAGPVMWYRGHESGDDSLRNAGMITTGVSALFTFPLSVRTSLFAQSGARRSVMDQQRFPGIIAATEQALIAREYGSPVMIRELRAPATDGQATSGIPVRLHIENVSDDVLQEVRVWFSTSTTLVLPDALAPGERFWETIVLSPENAEVQPSVQNPPVHIIALEVLRDDGSVWREDDPDVISDTLTVERDR